jgi:sn-glycerol 3-phosphate transport system ATP-binding protein
MGMADRIVLMQNGRIEQVGTPESIYREPASTFVAGFIGMPPMILIPETDIPPALRGPSNDRSQAVCGVRPEDFELVPPSPDSLCATVLRVEFQGSDSYVYVETEQRLRFVACVSARQRDTVPREGSVTGLTWKPQSQHRFDAHTGRRLAGAPCASPERAALRA